MKLVASVIVLLCCAWLASTHAHAEVLFEIDFGTQDRVDSTRWNPKARGTLPPEVKEDSGWAEIRPVYERYEDQMGGRRAWTEVKVEGFKRGRAQLLVELPPLTAGAYYKLSYSLASPTGDALRLAIMERVSPWKTHWEQTLPLERGRQGATLSFELPAIENRVGLIIDMGKKGAFELESLKLERRTRAQIEAELRAKYPDGGPANVLPDADFALGVPFGWGIRQKTHAPRQVRFDPVPAEGMPGWTALKVKAPDFSLSWGEDRRFGLWSPPFRYALPQEQHVASLYVKGTVTEGAFTVLEDEQPAVRKDLAGTYPQWTRIEMAYQPSLLSQTNIYAITASGEFQVTRMFVGTAENASADKPRQPQVQLEVNDHQSDIVFDREPAVAVKYHVAGDIPAEARLRLQAFDLYGATRELVTLPAVAGVGRLDIDMSGVDRPYGQHRVEAELIDADGESLGELAEVVYSYLREPRYWGRPRPESPFGIHSGYFHEHLYAAKALGFNWVRLHGPMGDLNYWSEMEKTRGEYVFFDDQMNHLIEDGFSVLGVLAQAPPWARITRKHVPRGWHDLWWQPENNDDFERYAEEITRHYRGRVNHWQVWNEPWGHFFYREWRPDFVGLKRWHVGDTLAEDYHRLSEAGFGAIRRGNPEAQVVGLHGSLGPGSAGWVPKMLALDNTKTYDIASFHAYVINRDESLLDSHPSTSFDSFMDNILAPLRALPSEKQKPIWMTEGKGTTGSPETGMLRHTLHLAKQDTRDAQFNAALTLNYHMLLLSEGVEKVFTYSLTNYPQWESRYRIYWPALTQPGGDLNLSSSSFAFMAWMLEDMAFKSKEPIGRRAMRYRFEAAEHAPAERRGEVVVVYSASDFDGSCRVELPKGAEAFDLWGNPLGSLDLRAGEAAFVVIPKTP
ncbi:MAG: hypothetical protein AAGI68_00790 [Planctomycetota bacterium]